MSLLHLNKNLVLRTDHYDINSWKLSPRAAYNPLRLAQKVSIPARTKTVARAAMITYSTLLTPDSSLRKFLIFATFSAYNYFFFDL